MYAVDRFEELRGGKNEWKKDSEGVVGDETECGAEKEQREKDGEGIVGGETESGAVEEDIKGWAVDETADKQKE